MNGMTEAKDKETETETGETNPIRLEEDLERLPEIRNFAESNRLQVELSDNPRSVLSILFQIRHSHSARNEFIRLKKRDLSVTMNKAAINRMTYCKMITSIT